jgi:thiamine-monophosphate kinase
VKAEDRFVEKLRGLLPDCGRVLIGPGDDAALIAERPGSLAATTDLLLEGTDFLPNEDPEQIGRRALAVNLSDLAAIGARPEFFLLSIAFASEKGSDYALAIVRGAISQAVRFGACLVGGDLSNAPSTVVSVALWGEPAGEPLLRSGGRPGDALWLSGYPGRAAAGLRLAERRSGAKRAEGRAPRPARLPSEDEELLAAYRDPVPRVGLGLWLGRERAASAAIDVSDGLGIDSGRLARASGVRAVIERDRIPVSPALAAFAKRESADPFDWILAGGDDYELLFAASENEAVRLTPPRPEWETFVTPIGYLEKGEGAVLRDRKGDRDISELGYDHLDKR